jgi:3-oxoacyl-[acyl-carrier protein] reductase
VRDLDGASVLVTGGGSGIGEATARHFCALGARVTICGRRAEAVGAVAADIGPACCAVAADVCEEDDRARMVAAAVEHGGGLDVLVNNAGNMYRGAIDELEVAPLRGLFDSNVVGPMLLTGLARPHLAERRGAVIFVGSIHNRRAFPGASPYAATKGAVETLTRVLAAELGADEIRVNCVAPGAVLTEINERAGLGDVEVQRARLEAITELQPIARIGEAREVAEAIAYLACAEWTTGAVLDVDGGLGLGTTNH